MTLSSFNLPQTTSREKAVICYYTASYPTFRALAHPFTSLITVSEHIATEMIAFDGFHNGWRHLILPLAQIDNLVLNAVLAAAEAHQRINQENLLSGVV